MRIPQLLFLAALVPGCSALLGACAGDAQFSGPIDGEPRLARDLLERSAARGPVEVALRDAPPSVSAEAAGAAAAAGVRGKAVSFRPGPRPDGYRLVLWFDGPAGGDAVCGDAIAGQGGTTGQAVAPDPGRRPSLAAAWCSGPVAIASVNGLAAGPEPAAVERMIWQATARLFPDPYPDQYGADLFGNRVRLGATVTP